MRIKRPISGFTPLEKLTGFIYRVILPKTNCSIKPLSRNRHRRRSFLTGFTFIELLLVTSLLSVIGLSIYATFTNGINFWLRINEKQATEDVVIFFDRISLDLRNSFRYTGIDFRGTDDRVSFPVIGEFQGRHGKTKGIGRVEYFFDAGVDSIKTRESNYSEVYKDKASPERELVTDIESLSFRYYYYDPDQKEYLWETSWQEKEDDERFGIVQEKKLPLAVKIMVEFKDGRLMRKFQRTVFVPASYYLAFTKEE